MLAVGEQGIRAILKFSWVFIIADIKIFLSVSREYLDVVLWPDPDNATVGVGLGETVST
jgi:hypothetical protein